MGFPAPEPGLVISFNFLWRGEHDQGLEHGRYARPCAIVVASRRQEDGALVVLVVPITHSRPQEGDEAVRIPPAVKRHLGLDDQPSWAIVGEVNEFAWPGYDLEPNERGEISYGFIPPELHAQIRDSVLQLAKTRRLKRTPR